jgi:hypothetical protein
MSSETLYNGQKIQLIARSTASGRYAGRAILPELEGRILDAEGDFATEEEARSAALSRAISEIDRERRFRGKP